MLLRYRQLKKSSDQKLGEQQKLIGRITKENEGLLKEIHHRVKNNLQVVSSLLSLQERSLVNDGAVAAIRDGRRRVQSLALAHQNLYQSESQDRVELSTYVKGLCQGIVKSYAGAEVQNLSLKTRIDHLVLDVDHVVSLGLIINELVSNAIDFSIGLDQAGEISVDLREDDVFLTLTVSDDGTGALEAEQRRDNQLGFKLIQVFLGKLNGTFEIRQDQRNHSICRFDYSTWKTPAPVASVSSAI